MFGGMLDLRDLVVSDVMIHRTDMITLDADDTPEDLVNAVIASPVTRIPLWRDNPENIVGILHVQGPAARAARGRRRRRQDRHRRAGLLSWIESPTSSAPDGAVPFSAVPPGETDLQSAAKNCGRRIS